MTKVRRWRQRLRRMLWVVLGVTLNDDFLNWASDVPKVLRSCRPAWMGVQEGKRRRYAVLLRRLFGHRYLVRQRMASEATRGVAVIVDTDQMFPVGDAVDDPAQLGWGYQELLPGGHGILPRGVVWQDCEVRKRRHLRRLRRKPRPRRLVRVASYHEVPGRVPFERRQVQRGALADWAIQSPIPVWLATDANTKTPGFLAAKLRARVRGFHVDHHFIIGRLRWKSKAKPLRWRTADHRPVAVLVKVLLLRPRRRKARS